MQLGTVVILNTYRSLLILGSKGPRSGAQSATCYQNAAEPTIELLPLPIFVHVEDADLHLHISTFLLVRPISVIVAVLGGHRRLVCHRCRILRRTSRCQNCLYNHSVNDDLLTQNKNSLTCAVRAQLFENYVDQVRGGPDMVFGEY